MQSVFHKSVVSNAGLVFYLIGRLFHCMVILVPTFYLPAILQADGNDFTPTDAAFSVTIIGIFSLIGRILTGAFDYLSDHALKIVVVLLNIGCAISIVMMVTHCLGVSRLRDVWVIFWTKSATGTIVLGKSCGN